MAFIATKPASNFTPPPVGMHVARCHKLIDLGTQPKTYQGKPTGEARKIMATFELLGDERMDNGQPFVINKSWFLSMHEKATLRKDLESWRGKAFTPEEEGQFDVSKLLGAYCLLNIVEEQGTNGNTYTKIKAITPLIKGMPKPEPVNPNVIFDADEPDMALYDTFSDKLKELIAGCKEWRLRRAGARPATTATYTPEPSGGFENIEDDPIPF